MIENMKSTFELWSNACIEAGDFLYKLEECEGRPETGLFKVTKEFIVGGHAFYETPVYFVWIDGRNIVATTNYFTAYNKYILEVNNGN